MIIIILERSGNKFRDFIRRRLESKRQRQRLKSSSGASKHALKIKDALKSPNNAKMGALNELIKIKTSGRCKRK